MYTLKDYTDECLYDLVATLMNNNLDSDFNELFSLELVKELFIKASMDIRKPMECAKFIRNWCKLGEDKYRESIEDSPENCWLVVTDRLVDKDNKSYAYWEELVNLKRIK